MSNKIKIIGVSGFARSGKDTFVKIASNILNYNGYTTQKFAFADGLKNDLDSWLKDKYGISSWTDNDEEKKLIRPFMVAHGCGKRIQTQGQYWIDKVELQIKNFSKSVKSNHVFFISDVRFPNEASWIHTCDNSWLVHLKKYNYHYSDSSIFVDGKSRNDLPIKIFDVAPNDEEAKNDPLVESKADFNLELKNVIEDGKQHNNIISVESLTDNTYLIEEIKKCLTHCPFLNIKT